MILFTKLGCAKCDWLKKWIMDIETWPREVTIEFMDIESYSGLAELAWAGLVGIAEKELPILVVKEKIKHEDKVEYITGAIRIKQYIETTLL